METEAILALISELYASIGQLRNHNTQLMQQLQERDAELNAFKDDAQKANESATKVEK